MNISLKETRMPLAVGASVTDDALVVDLDDGRSISAPLAWYPRLMNGTVAERNAYRLIGDGEGLHWEELDEDISVEAVLLGHESRESSKSLERWLNERK